MQPLNIVEIHGEVLELLSKLNNSEKQRGDKFFYTLRRENNARRLEKKYWFHGNDDYMVVSFWSGMDWKNRTPNIFFRITTSGDTLLHISAKDSILKQELAKNLFVEPLELLPNGKHRWIKTYKKQDYIQSLISFIHNDKLVIDRLIEENLSRLISEDVSNSIGFIDESDFNRWVNNINKYRSGGDSIQIPFSLCTFSVEKFKPIDTLNLGRIPKNSPFIFFTGENGSGKTSMLKALSIALGNRFYMEELGPDNSIWQIKCGINTPRGVENVRINTFEPNAEQLHNLPFCCFGAARLTIQNRRFLDEAIGDLQMRLHPLRSLFYHDAILKDLNRWLLNSLADSKIDSGIVRSQYESIKQMLIDIVPNLYDIREQPWDGTQELLYFEEDLEGNYFTTGVIFEHLSSGIKSLIAMLADMMIRLLEQQSEIWVISELAGIVMIDEIDIHLHPKWQRKLPEILCEYFPKIQFIVTTHSPIPLLGAPPTSKIFVVKRESKKGVYADRLDLKVDYNNLLPNSLLTSPIFDLENIIPQGNSDKGQLRTEDTYSEIMKNDNTRTKLKNLARAIRNNAKDI